MQRPFSGTMCMLLAVGLTACGAAKSGNLATVGSVHATISPNASASPAAVAPAAASTAPSTTAGVGPCVVTADGGGTGQPSGSTYYLPVVNLDRQSCFAKENGYAQTSRTPIYSAQGQATLLRFVSISRTRVYYLEGDGHVKYTAVDGGAGIATSVPGGAQAHATFAINPDDTRIAVSVLDYSTTPVRMRLYVEDLATGANHVDLFSSSSVYEWPVGWHAGNLIVAVGRAFTQTSAPNPYAAVDGYHLVDPATGNRISAMGTATCQVTGWLTAAGTACAGSGGLGFIDWSGKVTMFAHGTGFSVGALSPDGQKIASCCAGVGDAVTLVDASGKSQPTHATGRVIAWADSSHLISASTIDGPYTLVDLSSGALTSMPGGVLEAIFPEDLG
jgi:hypothetical protein